MISYRIIFRAIYCQLPNSGLLATSTKSALDSITTLPTPGNTLYFTDTCKTMKVPTLGKRESRQDSYKTYM